MDIKIEDNIPLPVRHSQYPFDRMQVGQSFAIEAIDRNKLATSATRYMRANKGTKFKTAHMPGTTQVRIWRVK